MPPFPLVGAAESTEDGKLVWAELSGGGARRGGPADGEPVWLESRLERDRRFPELASLECDTVSVCAVPLVLGDRRLGALRFSFPQPRLFDEDERRFVLALAAQTSQALDGPSSTSSAWSSAGGCSAVSCRDSSPSRPALTSPALYHSVGDGMDLGGDVYDTWPIGDADGDSPSPTQPEPDRRRRP